MTGDYDKIYRQFEENFRKEAESLISEDKTRNTLKMEKIRFGNAEKYNIPVTKIVGSSLVRYTKDMLRRCQPLFPIYYILSMFTSFFYCLLLWCMAKCVFLYFTGLKEAFSRKTTLTLPVIFIAIVVICNSVVQASTRKILFKCNNSRYKNKNARKRISLFNAICYFISAAIIIITALFIYLEPGKIPAIQLSLSEVFILTVAMLSISGIHNVIYSSHFTAFASIGAAILLHRNGGAGNAISVYKGLSLTSFLAMRNLPIAEYATNSQLKNEFNQWLRSRAVTFRVYGAIAFFITFVLTALCIWNIITEGISAGLLIFTIAIFLVTAMLLLEILSCNYIIKSCAG